MQGKRTIRALVLALSAIVVFGGDAGAQANPLGSEDKAFLPVHGGYLKAVKAALVRDWKKTQQYPFRTLCPLSITQEKGGKVVDVIVSSRCMLAHADAAALKASVLRTTLPYEGFEKWFWPTIVVDLKSWELGASAATEADSQVTVDPLSQQRFKPPLPPAARALRGTAVLVLTLDQEGDAIGIDVERSSGSAELDQQARYMAVNWTYFPEVRDGGRTTSMVRVPVAFEDWSPAAESAGPGLPAYVQALSSAVESRWVRPTSIGPADHCAVKVTQLPGGQVIDAWITSDCTFDTLGKNSVIAAVLKASPLPYAGFESVFTRTVVLRFLAKD